MIRYIIALLCSISLYAQTGAATVGALSGLNAIFPIDASTRGAEIINLFTSLYGRSVPSGAVYEIAIQTKYNGLLTWVQSVTGTTNNTLLIIRWGTTPTNSGTTAPVVIPVEQVVEVIFSVKQQTIISTPVGNPYSATNVTGTFPIYSISPASRAADVLSVYNYYAANLQNGIFKYMTIQSTLSGVSPPPYQALAPFSGTLSYVQSVALTPNSSGSFLQISYLQNNRTPLLTLDIAAEHISSITFTQN